MDIKQEILDLRKTLEEHNYNYYVMAGIKLAIPVFKVFAAH